MASTQQTVGAGKITEGTQIIGEGNFHYYVYNYPTASNTIKEMLVGSFPAKEAGKGVLVLGQTFNEKTDYDYKSTLFLVDTMAESLTMAANDKKLNSGTEQPKIDTKVPSSGENKNQVAPDTQTSQGKQSDNNFATDEELNKYCQNLEELLQKKVDQSHDLQEEVKRRKNGKLKVVLEIDVDAAGKIGKMEIAEPDARQRTNDDLVKVITSASPYKEVPKTENGLLGLRVVFNKKGELKIELR